MKPKKSWLERAGLVERVEDDPEDFPDAPYESEPELVDAASVDTINEDTLIADIYAKNDLTDRSRSIFKVEDVIASLPKEMTTESKRGAVIGILTSFNLTTVDVTSDGDRRVDVLRSVQNQIKTSNDELIEAKNAEIEQLKATIETLQKEISSLESDTKVSGDKIDTEVKKVTDLIQFIVGG